MAVPSGTITLAGNSILAEAYTSGTLSNVFPTGLLAKIIAVGSDVSDWAANNIIVFSKVAAVAFVENDANFLVFPQEYVLFKYTEPA